MEALENASLRVLDVSWNPLSFDPRPNKVTLPLPSWVLGKADGQQEWEAMAAKRRARGAQNDRAVYREQRRESAALKVLPGGSWSLTAADPVLKTEYGAVTLYAVWNMEYEI